MRGYNVLRKGILSGARADFPYAEQFIIAEKDGKKCLFIRIFNPLEKSIDGVKISIRTFDKTDKIVSEEKLSFVFSCKGGERTVLPQAIQIDDRAVTCEAEIESVACEGQLLKLVGNKVKSFYDPSFSQKADVASVSKKNREQSSLIRKPAKLLAFVVACFVLIAMLVTTFALSGYTDTHDTFSIDNVEYRFLNAADKDGDIVVTGYRGLAKNIVIPQEIEGHRIVGIDNNVFAHNPHMRTLVIEAEAAISDSAFANCYMLNSVKIRKPLAIGSYAFSMCQNLEKVEIEDASEITRISVSTFADCIKLKEFSVPQNVTEIGDMAFANCGALTTVSLPDSLKEIGSQAFANCYSLQKVVIPKNVKAIGSSVFENCSMINEFEYTTDIGNFYQWFGDYNYDVPASLEKVTYNGEIVSSGMFYEIPNVKKVSLPNAVYIDNVAFFACWNLQSVQLATGLLSIGSSAFELCSNLEEITLPQSVAKIGERAFSDCNQLTSVNIPNSITRIEDSTFSGCYNLAKVTLPSNLKEIGNSAFYYCANLNSIVIPDSVVSIEADAFSQCNSLTELTIPKIFGTGISYLFGASDRGSMLEIPLEKVTIKSENIPDYAFFYATRLKDVIANNANAIGEKAFYQCYSLENLDSLAIESLGEEAFYGCGALSNVNLSDKLESVPNYTFGFCSNLTSVTLPSALKSIGDYAFQYCTNLSVIDGGNQIKTIGSYAFLQCESLSNVTFPDGLQQIGDYAYQGCRALTSVELPSTVNTVGRGAFSECESLTYMSLPEVYGANGSTDFYFSYIFSGYGASDNTHCIPDSLSRVKITATSIPDNAFMYCKQLKTIEIPNAEIIGSNAFYDCSSLENLVLSENLITIQAYAFKNCYALSSIDIPSSVTSLGDYAFSGCQQLKKIKLPSSVETVGQSAFDGCSNIEEMTLPKIYNNNAYGNNHFSSLFGGYDYWNADYVPSALKKVTVSASEIPTYAFYGCRYIEEINIENATSIGDCAFQGCSSLQNIALSPMLTSIGNGAFGSCISLANINLPNGLTNIGESAFYDCSSLTQIDLPSTLKSIGENAFIGCKNLLEVYNLAGLDLNDCSQTGYVGYNAVKVYDSLSEPSVVQRVTDSQGFKYAICDGQAYLYDFAYISDEPIQYFYLYDNFIYNNITYPYVLCPDALDSLGNNYNIVLPKTLKFRYEANRYINNSPNVYYQGTADEWSENFGYSSYWWNNLYFKADCVHDYGCWAEKDGSIITSPDFSYRVIKEPTCSEEGIQERECLHCGYTIEEAIPLLPHNIENGTCTVCGITPVTITKDNISDYFEVTSGPGYTFIWTDEGILVSTNQGIDSSQSSISLVAKGRYTIEIGYYVSSETHCDLLKINIGSTQIAADSGDINGVVNNVMLGDGETLSFVYSKDGSVMSGSDMAQILWIKIYSI